MNAMAFAQMVHPGRSNYACGGIGIYMQGRPVEQFIHHARRTGMSEENIRQTFAAESFNVPRLTKHACSARKPPGFESVRFRTKRCMSRVPNNLHLTVVRNVAIYSGNYITSPYSPSSSTLLTNPLSCARAGSPGG